MATAASQSPLSRQAPISVSRAAASTPYPPDRLTIIARGGPDRQSSTRAHNSRHSLRRRRLLYRRRRSSMTPTSRHGAFLATLLGVAACAPSTDADPDRASVPLQKEEVATLTQSAGAAPTPVKVVNTAGDWQAPVPTTLTGTASVSAQQSGSWTVGVSGPVTLGPGS